MSGNHSPSSPLRPDTSGARQSPSSPVRLSQKAQRQACHDRRKKKEPAEESPTGLQAQMDDRHDDGLYSGTFRWAKSKKFLPLPPPPANEADCMRGWFRYLSSRSEDAGLVHFAKTDSSLLDSLSFSVTLVFVMQKLQLIPAGCKEYHIVMLGATSKAEERLLRETGYFWELAHQFPDVHIHLWVVGPEVSGTSTSPSGDRVPRDPEFSAGCRKKGWRHACPSNFSASLHHVDLATGAGCARQFLLERPWLTAENAALITYNGGFGNFIDSGRYDLLWSWMADLHFIAQSNIPAIFTQVRELASVTDLSR